MSRAQDDRQTIEKPLDRLNYYNGQRLEARDLCLEQAYHMRMRRWLNKSLYPDGGIVNGLEVLEIEGTSEVVVTAGLALDTQGREIILLEDTPVQRAGEPRECILTIRYDEHTTGYEQDGCTPRSEAGTGVAGSSLAWSGPALVRAEPVFAWRDAVPPASSDEIALARVVLTDDCEVVKNVDLSVRQLADKPGDTVRQFALEGFRDIDADNPQRVYFHIRGRQPAAVTLYLRAERFSPLYYTELAEHDHQIAVDFADHELDSHTHTLDLETDTEDLDSHHHHGIWMQVEAPMGKYWPRDPHNKDELDAKQLPGTFHLSSPTDDGFDTWRQKLFHGNTQIGVRLDSDNEAHTEERFPFVALTGPRGEPPTLDNDTNQYKELTDGEHFHSITGESTGDDNFSDRRLRHESPEGSPPTIGFTGVELDPDTKPRTGEQIAYVNNLQVRIDGVPQTTNILTQIQDANRAEDWDSLLGDGTTDHPFVVPHDEPYGDRDGTGPIRLDFLENTNFTEGEHYIEFGVDKLEDEDGNDLGNGGRIYYNLYVE